MLVARTRVRVEVLGLLHLSISLRYHLIRSMVVIVRPSARFLRYCSFTESRRKAALSGVFGRRGFPLPEDENRRECHNRDTISENKSSKL